MHITTFEWNFISVVPSKKFLNHVIKIWEGSSLHSGDEAQNHFGIYLLGSDI